MELGLIGVIASVDYALSIFIGYFIRMFDGDFNLTVWTIFAIYLCVLELGVDDFVPSGRRPRPS